MKQSHSSLASYKSPRDSSRGKDHDHYEIQRCVDSGIADVFGKGLVEIVYRQLETEAKFKKEGIINRPKEFAAGLVQILGKGYAEPIEEAIRNRIVAHFDLEPKRCSNMESAIIVALKILQIEKSEAQTRSRASDAIITLPSLLESFY